MLDPGATLYFVTPLVVKNFDVLPDVLIELFLVSTSVGDSVVAKRVYRNIIVLHYFPIKCPWWIWYNLICLTLMLFLEWIGLHVFFLL